MDDVPIRLRPVDHDHLAMLRRFPTEPGLTGLAWNGFRDAGAPTRRTSRRRDGYLYGRLRDDPAPVVPHAG